MTNETDPPTNVGSTAGLGVDAAHELERRGYELKHTHRVGFWVDGRCGYMVSGGYFDTAQRACETAWERVQEAEANDREPAWKFPTPNLPSYAARPQEGSMNDDAGGVSAHERPVGRPKPERDTDGQRGAHGCACLDHDSVQCAAIRYGMDHYGEACTCLCHQWGEDDENWY